jgi:hypothetical protein
MHPIVGTGLARRLCVGLTHSQVLTLARQTKFCRRRPKKIAPWLFLLGCCQWAFQPRPSLRMAASLLGVLGRTTVSKQALAKRSNPAAVEFVRQLLQRLLQQVACSSRALPPRAFAGFRRVLLQDSTAVALPARLAAEFPGSRNGRAAAQAMLKIQTVYDLLAEQFVQFGLTPFTTNDQAAAADICQLAQRGDLVVRDLGYFVLDALRQCVQQGIYFLSRLWVGTTVLSADGQQELDLLGKLRRDGFVDTEVCLGQQQKLRVRLVALPVPEAVANERRRRARHNRDRRCPPSAKRLLLLGWDLFITNVGEEVWPARLVGRIYGLRWRIEIVFKSWKSHFHLETFPCASGQRIQLLIWARLLVITLFYSWLAGPPPQDGLPARSLLKLAAIFDSYFVALLVCSTGTDLPQRIRLQIDYHCRYEKRRRLSYPQRLGSLS